MSKALTVLLINLLVFASCTDKKEDGFILNGVTSALQDGTKLQLINVLDNTVIDSTIVQDGTFQLKGQLPFYPINTVLATKNYKDFNNEYRSIWIERGEMTITTSAEGLAYATSRGSVTDQLYFEHSLSRRKLRSRKDILLADQKFIQKHPSSIVSAMILDIYSTTWGKEKIVELYDTFSNEVKESVYGKRVSDFILLNKDLKVGDQYVDFSMTDIEDTTSKLSDYDGKIVLLEFWASWCKPCREENPNLVATYKKYHPHGFEVFAVSLDHQKESWKRAIDEDGLEWIHVSDLNGRNNRAVNIYGVNGIPDNFLIDQNGIIIGRALRGEELNKKLSQIII